MPFLILVFTCLSMTAPFSAQTPGPVSVPAHDNFRVAIYIPVAVVERMKDPAYLQSSWEQISSQIKVDKVYIESYRSGVLADDALLETVKSFFISRGVQVAGGIAFAAGGDTAGSETVEAGQFVSFSYTDPNSRAYVKNVSELTARHFDEIVLDDFFFNNTKRDSDIAAKGTASWTAFRLGLMDEVSRDLVVGPAKAVNPKVKMIIKFPNWYEHFQANGYDLGAEPKIFDGIYTGTETRDPVITDQHLQQYESYQIVRYFDNIAPGRNGGGWVDTFDTRYLDRYAEQLWDTMLAKAPEIMLFQWSNLVKPAELGDRKGWSGLETSFNVAGLEKWRAASTGPVNYASVAGYSLSTVNAVVGKLGTPIGIASYKPYQTAPDNSGEDFLHNYLGMIGIPIDLHPEFPVDAKTVLLTESAKSDPEIVGKIKAHLVKGGNVIITSGLLRALEDKGIEQIVELHATGNVLKTTEYWGAFGAGGGTSLGSTAEILVPEIDFQTNDAWPVVRGTANGRGAPLLIMDRYSKGILYVLTIPEDPTDLYALPQPALTAIREYLLRDFRIQIDAPSLVSLFAYDNHSFVVESYRDAPVLVTVYTLGTATHLRNLATGEVVQGSKASSETAKATSTATSIARRRPPQADRTEFHIEVAPHSFLAFVEE
ncbi:MAG: hypothetical protein ABSC76_02125 [Terracidiphilus sp.]|jgi:hypothetical protein